MSSSEDEIYSTMFTSLKHPSRRKILRMLSERSMTFSQMLEELKISSSHLTYHLESLGELVLKIDDGKYALSSFGEATVDTMRGVEEVPLRRSKGFLLLPFGWKAVFALLLVGLLLLGSFSAFQYASLSQLSKDQDLLKIDLEQARAENQQLISWGTGTDKAITFIRDVIGIDIKQYQAALLSDTVQYRSDLGGVQEEVLKYSLSSSDSKIDLILRFRNNHFSRYQLLLDEGTPFYSRSQSGGVLTIVQSFVEKYQSYSRDPYLQEMQSLLSLTDEFSANSTIFNQTKLQITSLGNTKEVLLMYTENGVDFSPKSLRLVFQNELLTEITDGYFLLTVANTKVNISQQQAIEIAENYASSFKWNLNGVEISNFSVLESAITAQFVPHPRDVQLALTPYWYVTLPLQGVYAEGINRLTVGVWADTGEVANAQALSG
jgi:DNA-binding transcriptional ArsR family regulator